jgi:holo-[acyl-carrier protein] synthase
MRIAGIGTQIVECLRVRKLIERHAERFLTQVYTPQELSYIRERRHTTEHYAAIWAGKEAVYRCLGTTWHRGMAWTDIEILCENLIEPGIILKGQANQLLLARQAKGILVSLAHCRAYATATAIAVRG